MAKNGLKYGVALLSIVPVRVEPSEKAEMCTQLLFGESFEILRERKGWFYIRMSFDGYEGYVSPNMIELLPDRVFLALQKSNQFVSGAMVQHIIHTASKTDLRITSGSTIPYYNGKFSFRIGLGKFRFKSRPPKMPKPGREEIVEMAMKFLHSPYQWGGRSPFGFDCSGFTQIVFKVCGISLARDAAQQVRQGTVVNWVNEGKPGDLAFFQNHDGVIVHVGILLGEGKIIHCSGQVRIDSVDHEGINHSGTRRYTHHLRVVKNVIG